MHELIVWNLFNDDVHIYTVYDDIYIYMLRRFILIVSDPPQDVSHSLSCILSFSSIDTNEENDVWLLYHIYIYIYGVDRTVRPWKKNAEMPPISLATFFAMIGAQQKIVEFQSPF